MVNMFASDAPMFPQFLTIAGLSRIFNHFHVHNWTPLLPFPSIPCSCVFPRTYCDCARSFVCIARCLLRLNLYYLT